MAGASVRRGGLANRIARPGALVVKGVEPLRRRKTIQQLPDDVKIFDLYYWETVLQEDGDGGKVVVCRLKDSVEPDVFDMVMKIRSKQSLRDQGLEETFRKVQKRMLNVPPHVGVIPVCEVMEDEKYYYIVMEKATGGSFFEGLLNEFTSGVIPAFAVRRLTKEILEGVGHLHGQGMLHRDIKPDNFVMMQEDDLNSPTGYRMRPSLVDFDHVDPEAELSPKLPSPASPTSPTVSKYAFGTDAFNAPETFLGYYSEQSDLYSVGVCIYLLMAGKLPYDDEIFAGNIEEVYPRLRDAEVDWKCDPWPEQPDCTDFCRSVLAFDPKDRLATVADAQKHQWFQQDS